MTTQTEILLARVPKLITKFWCMACQKDRDVEHKRIKVTFKNGSKHKMIRCTFCE